MDEAAFKVLDAAVEAGGRDLPGKTIAGGKAEKAALEQLCAAGHLSEAKKKYTVTPEGRTAWEQQAPEERRQQVRHREQQQEHERQERERQERERTEAARFRVLDAAVEGGGSNLDRETITGADKKDRAATALLQELCTAGLLREEKKKFTLTPEGRAEWERLAPEERRHQVQERERHQRHEQEQREQQQRDEAMTGSSTWWRTGPASR
jgi:ribosomal protein S19E (S16A)